ncbi:MAG: hypothetical protein NW201_02065 [Gemmatimonadales bacterium]|nr:hypothetical protein [Gemmatimonadales bacterium]
MSGLLLALRAPLAERVDLAALTAPGWQALDAAALGARVVRGLRSGAIAAGDLFTIRGAPGPLLTLEGDLALADHVGAGLDAGTVHVRGSVGARAGAAAPGAKRGMTGGALVVFGDAGPEAGASMRRGCLAIAGRAGPAAGLAMLAGTIVVAGAVGEDGGRFSKRGSLVAFGDVTIPGTYRHACTYQPQVLRLLLAHLRSAHGFAVPGAVFDGRWERWSGDLAESGKGEILTHVRPEAA